MSDMTSETSVQDLDPADDRNFVTALARGLEVLRCFRQNETTLTNQDIAARTGLPKPTVTRLTYTLCKLGYLNHSERTGTYRLGAGVLALGYGALAGMEIAERAADQLKEICEGPNRHITSGIAERHRLHVINIAVHRSSEAVALTMNVGARLPLFYSAAGRAVLVAMSEREREALIDHAIKETPDESQRIVQSAEKAVADFHDLGFCTSFGEWSPDINGIAAPIVSLNGDRFYGLNIGGPSFLVPEEVLMDHYGARLKTVAQGLSRSEP